MTKFVIAARFPQMKRDLHLHRNYTGRAWSASRERAERFETREAAEKVTQDFYIVRGATRVSIVEVQ